MAKDLLRQLPSIDSLIITEELKALAEKYNRDSVVHAARTVIEDMRTEILKSKEKSFAPEAIAQERIIESIKTHLQNKFTASLKKAINATGVILHTGLGRAALPKEAQDAIDEVIEGYCTLATDLSTGRRSHRDNHLNGLLCELTGAEAATVVNNNAAATMLILNTLAKDKEVIVSRGQLVEIGGSFRMPDVMRTSGAILKEVGTTNKTHLKDYAQAINENTGAIMRVHHSNYRILGFASEPSVEELAGLAKKHDIYLIDDLGSGALVNMNAYGLEPEPLVQNSIKAGVDAACFSADKLIGGPQAGIILGKRSSIEKISENPLTRALRVGKLTIAGLEATLRLFLTPEKINIAHPVYRMFSVSLPEIEKRVKRAIRKLSPQIKGEAEISLVDGGSQVGSGSVPVETIPTKLLSIKPVVFSPENLAKQLRMENPPIFTRVHKESVLFDFRTIQEGEDKYIIDALLALLKKEKPNNV